MKTAATSILPIYGTSLSNGDFCPEHIVARAEKRAKEKLARIIEREGDLNGERLKPEYLEQLIGEALRESRFAQYSVELFNIRYKGEKEKPAAVAAGQF